MAFMKRIQKTNLDEKLQGTLLLLMVVTGCTANLAGFLSNAVLFGLSVPTIACGICEVIMIICGIAAIVFHHGKIAAAIMVLVLVVGEFPFLFYIYGAETSVYLLLGILILAIYHPRPYHIYAITTAMIVDIAAIVLHYLRPLSIEAIPEDSRLWIMICSYIICALTCAIVICMLIRLYLQQRKQLMEQSKQLEYASITDGLTGIYNRRYLDDILEKWIHTEHISFLTALIDVDDFKEVNDTYGHLFGDEVLKELARLMKQKMEGKGIAARYGGEEFMFLFEHSDIKEAVKIINEIKDELGDYTMKCKGVRVTFSGGIEEYRADAKIDELLRNVDRKLYRAKRSGKNMVVETMARD